MSTIVTINSGDQITNSRADINTNFANLNSDKIETSYLDTDTTLAANSDSKIATQKAVKAYVDAGGNVNASETTKGIVEEATDAEVTAGAATGGTGAKLVVTPAKLETRLAARSTVNGGGVATRVGTAASGSQTIAHGLGVAPSFATFQVMVDDTTTTQKTIFSNGSSNGTTHAAVYSLASVSANAFVSSTTTNCINLDNNLGDTQVATAAFDATNITLTWTKGGSGMTGTIRILWWAIK